MRVRVLLILGMAVAISCVLSLAFAQERDGQLSERFFAKYLTQTADPEVSAKLARQINRELEKNFGDEAFRFLERVKTRDELITLLRAFVDACEACETTAQVTHQAVPTVVANELLGAKHAVDPVRASHESNSTGLPDTMLACISAEDLKCLNCLDVHCP
ncbi:MAG: hypothetical protein OXU20_17335 [Myxococcales bacterium]|nr:hypothetical protein [Myxococcales bacterium]